MLKSLASLVVGFFLVRCVEPARLGLWNSVSLATTYAFFLQAGVINGLSRELPFHLGAQEHKKAENLAGTSQMYTLAGCAISLLLGLVSVVVFWNSSLDLRLAILAVTAGTAFTFYQNYLTVTFRSKSSFRNLAWTQVGAALLALTTIPMLYWWKYEGMLARSVLVSVIVLWMMHLVRPMRVPLAWDWSAFRLLMTTGLPIFALSYLDSTSGTADRLILLKLGGVESVGYYSLAIMVQGAITMIPLSFAMYIYPRMTYSYGQKKDPLLLWRTASRTTLAVFLVMVPIVFAGWFLLPLVVFRFFPNYGPGAPAAQIALVSGLFSGGKIGVNAIWSLKAWGYMTSYQLISSALRIIGPVTGAILAHDTLTGVAMGLLVAHITVFTLSLSLTYRVTHRCA